MSACHTRLATAAVGTTPGTTTGLQLSPSDDILLVVLASIKAAAAAAFSGETHLTYHTTCDLAAPHLPLT